MSGRAKWERVEFWTARFNLGWGEYKRSDIEPGFRWRLIPLHGNATVYEHVDHAWQARRAIREAAMALKWRPHE